MNKNMKKAITTRDLLLLAACIVGLWSCDKNSEEMKQEPSVAPGIYSTEITVSAESGKSSDVSTRGLDTEKGEFTTVYPYDYIYIHSADNNEDGSHKSLQVPLKEVIYCNECRGIHLEVEVLADGSGYTIKNESGVSIQLSQDESVYLSTYPKPFWEPEKQGATPVSGSDVFVESEANQELLKSQKTYNMGELVALIQDPLPSIEMERHCTGFRIYFMFTDVPADETPSYVMNSTLWPFYVPETKPTDFYIKLYLGPNFASKYDILNDKVTANDNGGYYCTNGQQYKQFEFVNYGYTGGSTTLTYTGYGYTTTPSKYLISPLNKNIDASNFSIYAFIKYSPSGTPDLNSDAGAKYFQAVIPDITLDPNRIHYVIMAFDAHDLQVFTQAASPASLMTRSPWEGPEEIDIKPVKVICR